MVTNGMRPIHPDEILREEFVVALGMSADSLSRLLQMSPSRLTDILHEKGAASQQIWRCSCRFALAATRSHGSTFSKPMI